MKLDKYKNYIFDFDGTIVDLKVNWKSLKKELDTLCKKKNINPNLSFYKKIQLLKLQNKKIFSLIKKYEQPKNKIYYKSKKKTLKLISQINTFYIVSNNLTSTIKKILTELKLRNKCKFILGLNNSLSPKPNAISLKRKMKLLKGKSIYIGDKMVDRKFAKNAEIDFKFQKQI